MFQYEDGRSSDNSSQDGRPGSAGSGGSEQRGHSHSLGPKKLLEMVETIYKSFNPAQVTLDTHVGNCLSQAQLQNSHDDTFVRQVVYGIVRYRNFLGCIMDSFYHYNGGIALREDMDTYKIFGYLTIFRLEELGHAELKRLVDAKEPQKMVVFLRYLFNPHYLNNALRDDWLKLYDKQFVDDIIRQLVNATPGMNSMLDALDDKVYFTRRKSEGVMSLPGSAAEVASNTGAMPRQATVPQPFNLSQPRPKPSQVEVALPPAPPARPAPPPRSGPTKEQLTLQATKEANRRRLEAKWARAKPFKLSCLERPSTLDKIRQEIEADMERQLTFSPLKSRPAPPPPVAQVRLNAAAVLREDALYRKKQAEEAAMLQKYEAELRDARAHKIWQQEMLGKDEEARQAEVNARRAEMVAVHEAAARARANQIASNLEVGRQLKEQAKALAAALETEKSEEVRQKQAKRQQVVEARGGVAAAAEALAADKRSAAEEERKRQAADAKALMEAQLKDNAEKRDLIMQLRALEKVPRQRVAEFDPSQTPDHGLLTSMPLVELRERLAVAKRRAQEEEERRRAANLAARQDRDDMLLSKAANIQRIRKIAAAQAAQRKDQSATTADQKKAKQTEHYEDSVVLLTSKLEAKRAASAAEKARLAAETKKIRFEQMQQAAGASAVEANKFHELRAGAAREARARQATTLDEAGTFESTRVKAQQVRSKAVQQQAKAKLDFLKEYDMRVFKATAQLRTEQEAEASWKKQRASVAHAAEQTAVAKHHHHDQMSSTTSKSTLQARLAALARGLSDEI